VIDSRARRAAARAARFRPPPSFDCRRAPRAPESIASRFTQGSMSSSGEDYSSDEERVRILVFGPPRRSLRLASLPLQEEHEPLGSRFQDCCRTTRERGGLPEGEGIPTGITHDLVLLIDTPARRMEREKRLLAMHGGCVNETLFDICEEGGGRDAHGEDANHREENGWRVLERAARHGHVSVVEALLDAGAGELGQAFARAAYNGHTGHCYRHAATRPRG